MRRLFPHMRNAAENKESDLTDRNPIGQRNVRMAQLMEQDRHEQQHGRNGAHAPIALFRQSRQIGRQKSRRQAGCHEKKNEEPGGVDPNGNPQRTADFPGTELHACTVTAEAPGGQFIFPLLEVYLWPCT